MSGICLVVSPGNELTTSHAVRESSHIDTIVANGENALHDASENWLFAA